MTAFFRRGVSLGYDPVPVLSHREGWDLRDPDLERRELKPTVDVHGHTPALRRDIASGADLEICNGVDSRGHYVTGDADLLFLPIGNHHMV